MASITIEIEGIEYAYAGTDDEQDGEFNEALTNIASIIESAVENAFSTEGAVYMGAMSVSIDEDA